MIGECTVLKRLNDPRYATLRTPSEDAIALLRNVLGSRPDPAVAEIGVGVGATTAELAKLLNNRGELHLFDFEDTLSELLNELKESGFSNIVPHPNGRKTFESYNWNLAKMLREMRQAQQSGIFDLVYLDGDHTYHHDAPAALTLKELLKPGGYLLFDDYKWTIAASQTANPKVNKSTASNYSEEQINEPHIALICELFFDHDPKFVKVDLGYEGNEFRRAYQKSLPIVQTLRAKRLERRIEELKHQHQRELEERLQDLRENNRRSKKRALQELREQNKRQVEKLTRRLDKAKENTKKENRNLARQLRSMRASRSWRLLNKLARLRARMLGRKPQQ
jgi:SAM-dependent methyltransferase